MSKRSNVRAVSAFVFIVAALGAAFGACTQYKAYTGEICLKDEDCIAGSCLAGVCTQPSPILSGTPAAPEAGSPDTGGANDSGPAAVDSGDSGDDGPAVPPIDSGNDTGLHDAGHDAADASNQQNDASDASDAADAADATGAREVPSDSLPA